MVSIDNWKGSEIVMKIVVGSIQHESNTFTPIKARYGDFYILRGIEMLPKISATEIFREAGVDVIPTIYANSVPSGVVEYDSFIRLKEELIEKIPENEKIDGIWLYLHGAMEVEGIDGADGGIVSEIRSKVGENVPIAVTLDFHANNSEKLVNSANIICGYRTAPHTDIEETQIRAAKLLLRCIKEKLLPKPIIVRPPLNITGDKVTTNSEPAKSLVRELERVERDREILSISLFNGQPWVDSINTGASVVAIPLYDSQIALESAKYLANLFWKVRNNFNFQVEALEPEEAIDRAINLKENPIFITDSGDNVTAGAPGDNTYLLKLLLREKMRNVLVGGITDSHAVELCNTLSIGEEIRLSLGAEVDKRSEHTTINGILKGKGRVLGWDGEDGGRSVIINTEGIDVIVTERRCAFTSPEVFNSIGIDIFNYKIIVVKLGYLYPKLEEISKYTIMALTPGCSCESIERLGFNNIRRPMYPIDRDFEWEP
mgnify:CR=1 FL=1